MSNIHLSISRINTYLRCPRQYEYSYVEGIKIPPSGALVRGSSFHEAMKHNFREKKETGKDSRVSDLLDVYSDQFTERIQEAQLKEDERRGRLKDSGVKMVRAYRRHRAPQITPDLVEQRVELELATGDLFIAVIDLSTLDMRIVDLKTTSKTPPKGEAKKNQQLTAYGWAYYHLRHEMPAGYDLDFAVHNHKAKKPDPPRLITLPAERTAAQLDAFARDVAHVFAAIQAGAFPRNAQGWHCSPEYCGYWNMCMGRQV